MAITKTAEETTLTRAAQPLAAERRFFAGMTYAAAAIVFAGFATSYYLWPITRLTHYPTGRPISPSLPLLVHLHAAIFTGWVGLLVAQAVLVTRGSIGAHRRAGRAGAVLMVGMVLAGLMTSVQGARDGWNPGGPYRDALSFMFVGIADIAVFTVLTAAGLAWRGRPEVHRRLMVLGTTGGLLWPAITRTPGIAGGVPLMFGVLASVVLAPAIRDFVARSRYRWLTLLVGLGVLATFPLRVAIGNSDAWRAFAAWITR